MKLFLLIALVLPAFCYAQIDSSKVVKKIKLSKVHDVQVKQLRILNNQPEEVKTYHTRAVIVNSSSKKVKFLLKNLVNPKEETVKITLKSGDSLDLGSYETTDGYDQIEHHFYIESLSNKSKSQYSAKSEDTFPEGDLLKRLTVIELFRLTE